MACRCPEDVDSAGRRCGNRAAACRDGGETVSGCLDPCGEINPRDPVEPVPLRDKLSIADGIEAILPTIQGDSEEEAVMRLMAATGIRAGREGNLEDQIVVGQRTALTNPVTR